LVFEFKKLKNLLEHEWVRVLQDDPLGAFKELDGFDELSWPSLDLFDLTWLLQSLRNKTFKFRKKHLIDHFYFVTV
jgi:hypothetical protein